MVKPIIVIADDEKDVLHLLAVFFKMRGYQVYTAQDGLEALQLIEQYQPNAAVLDFMMPGMNGVDACQIAKQKFPNLFVMLLSGVGYDQLKDISRACGADDCMEKPVHLNLLYQRLESELALHRAS